MKIYGIIADRGDFIWMKIDVTAAAPSTHPGVETRADSFRIA
jgi:hypothetical protein